MRFSGHSHVANLRSRAAIAALSAGGVESTLAIWPEQGNLARADARMLCVHVQSVFKTRERRSMAVTTASKTPRIGARGSPAGARQNGLFTGCGCFLRLGDSGAGSRALALLGRSPLSPLYLRNAATASRVLFPILIAKLCTSNWDTTWTATTTEQSGINPQVISRKPVWP